MLMRHQIKFQSKQEMQREITFENQKIVPVRMDTEVKRSFIEYNNGPDEEEWVDISILPDGYARIDVLQKNTAYGRNVLVAMKFGDDTKNLREAIRKGVAEAGYIAIFIDEVQHNDFITPELLKHIRDSKFVVVDLTHQNNGAYFEEGYAMGLGKPVIQLCQQDTKLHFDIAQKQILVWDNYEDLTKKLEEWIKAIIAKKVKLKINKPEAKPSRPSLKFTPFEAPAITIIAKGIYNQLIYNFQDTYGKLR